MLEGLLLWTWLLLPGCRALTGPTEASGPLGGSLVVTCAYEAEQAEAEKYWCRGRVWLFCSVLVAAAGAEASAERLRLRDERARRLFAVTMQNLTAGDGDTYWCGVRQPWHDAMVPVVVTVLPASHTTDPYVYTAQGYELTTAASSPSHPPGPASTTATLNSSSPWAGVPSVTVLTLTLPAVLVLMVLSIIAGLGLRRASRGKSSTAGRTGHKDGRVRRHGGAARPNIYANVVQELGSSQHDYEKGPGARQDSARRCEASSSGRKGSAADAQPIYTNMPPGALRSGPRCQKARGAPRASAEAPAPGLLPPALPWR